MLCVTHLVFSVSLCTTPFWILHTLHSKYFTWTNAQKRNLILLNIYLLTDLVGWLWPHVLWGNSNWLDVKWAPKRSHLSFVRRCSQRTCSMHELRSIRAGPRFLSVGFIMSCSFCFRSFRALLWMGVSWRDWFYGFLWWVYWKVTPFAWCFFRWFPAVCNGSHWEAEYVVGHDCFKDFNEKSSREVFW